MRHLMTLALFGAPLALVAGILELSRPLSAQEPRTNVCGNAVQGQIAWNYEGTTTWARPNVERLCRGAEDSAEPARCFDRVLHGGVSWGGGSRWQWINALDLCEGTRDAEATISCFQRQVASGQAWSKAIESCDERAARVARSLAGVIRSPAIVERGVDVERPARGYDPNLPNVAERLRQEGFLHAAALAYRHRRAAVELAHMSSREFNSRVLVAAGGAIGRGVDLPALRFSLARKRREVDALKTEFLEAAEDFAARASANVDRATPDAALTTETALAPDLRRLGLALSYTTLLNAPGMGADLECAATPLIIMGEGDQHFLGPLFQYFSAAASLWDRTTPEATARGHVLGKLAELLDALQCMSTRELAELEAVYAAGLTDVLNRLAARRARHLARALWDATLPVTLLMYDAVKYFKLPVSYYLLRFPAALSLTLPEPNRAAPVRLTAFGTSLASRLYCASSGGAGLTLNRLGIWFEDATRPDVGLGQVITTTPCDLLRDMTDLPRLGEGDCPMLLFTQRNNACPGPKTCAPYDAPGGEFASQALTGPLGEIFSGAGASPTAMPGMPGSSRTHFGTARGSGIQQGCEAGGSDAAGGCFIPTPGSPRPGQLSSDPELDRMLRCALAIDTGRGTENLAQHMSTPSPGCLAGQAGDEDETGDEDDEQPDVQGSSDVASDEEVEEAVRDAADEVERNRQAIITAVSDELRRAGFGSLTLMQRLRLSLMIDRVVQMTRDGRMGFTLEDLRASGLTGGFAWSTAGSIATDADGGWILIDTASTQAELTETVSHELVHAALSAWAISESPRGFASVEPLAPGAVNAVWEADNGFDAQACAAGNVGACSVQHRVVHRTVGYMCDSSAGCTDGCRYVDPRTKALTECLGGTTGTPPRVPTGNPCATALSCPRDTYSTFYTANLSSCVGHLDVDAQSTAACAHVLCSSERIAASLSGCCRPDGTGVGGPIAGPPPWCRFIQMNPPPPECPGGRPPEPGGRGGIPAIPPPEHP